MFAATQPLEHAFKAFDRDASGGIDQRELETALCEMGIATNADQAAAILKRYDTNANGVLEISEFKCLFDELRDFHACTQRAHSQPQDQIARMFHTFDADGSHSIEHHELVAALNSLGLQADGAKAAAVLKRYDADGNGRLDADEWRRLVTDLAAFHRATA